MANERCVARDARVLALLFAMTKDRALVLLGMSSKMRTKVRELEAAKVHGRVADKRAQLAEARAELMSQSNSASSRCETAVVKLYDTILNE